MRVGVGPDLGPCRGRLFRSGRGGGAWYGRGSCTCPIDIDGEDCGEKEAGEAGEAQPGV